jgi:hypothetical protein
MRDSRSVISREPHYASQFVTSIVITLSQMPHD